MLTYGRPTTLLAAILVPAMLTYARLTSAPHEEGYTLNVTAARGIPSDGKIAIASSTPKGAAYALTTLAQLLRYDDGPWVGGSQHVLDFVPLSIAGA